MKVRHSKSNDERTRAQRKQKLNLVLSKRASFIHTPFLNTTCQVALLAANRKCNANGGSQKEKKARSARKASTFSKIKYGISTAKEKLTSCAQVNIVKTPLILSTCGNVKESSVDFDVSEATTKFLKATTHQEPTFPNNTQNPQATTEPWPEASRPEANACCDQHYRYLLGLQLPLRRLLMANSL